MPQNTLRFTRHSANESGGHTRDYAALPPQTSRLPSGDKAYLPDISEANNVYSPNDNR